MAELLNTLARLWWDWTAAMFWQVGLLTILIGCLDLLVRKWAWPQLRYALWSLILIKLLLPPTLSLPSGVVPGLQSRAVQALRALEPEKPTAVGNPDVIADCGLQIADLNLGSGSQFATTGPQAAGSEVPVHDLMTMDSAQGANPQSAIRNPQFAWQFHAMMIWLAGTFLLGTWLWLRLHALAGRHAYSAAAASLPQSFYNQLAGCAERLGLRRVPAVAVTKKLATPAVFGVLRPVLLMPQGSLSKLSRKDTEHMLLHELAHIKRGDLLTHGLYMLLQILYWYNPLLWLVRRQMHHLRELSCDATVAGLLREQTKAYRQTLLDSARRLLATSVEPGLGLLGLFEDSNRLLVRLNWLTKPTWRYKTMKRAIVATIAALMVACVLPMAQARESASNETIEVTTDQTQHPDEVIPVKVEEFDQQSQDQLSRDMAKLQAQLEQLKVQQQQLQEQLHALAAQRRQMRSGERIPEAPPREEGDWAFRGDGWKWTPGAPAGPGEQRYEVYTVQPGDTLASIAKQFYGRERKNLSEDIARIVKMNRLEGTNELREGQKLRIPVGPDMSEDREPGTVRKEQVERAREAYQRAQDDMKRAMKEAAAAQKEAERAAAEARHAQAQNREMEAWGGQMDQWENTEAVRSWERDMEKWGQQMERWGQELGQRMAAGGGAPAAGASSEAGLPPVPPMPPMPAMPPVPPAPAPHGGMPGEVHVPSINAPRIEMPRIDVPVVVPPEPPEPSADSMNEKEATMTRTVDNEPLPPGRVLELVNQVGSISVRSGAGETCRITATIKGRAPTMEEAEAIVQQVRFDITRSDDRLHVAMTKPEKRDDRKGPNYSVHFEVVVPRGARMKLSQAVGDIRLAGLRGSVEAFTQVGTIRAADVSGQVALSANVGGIDYAAPAGLSAKVQAKANLGGIQSDLPLAVAKSRGPAVGSSAFGTIGQGEDNISLSTNTGSIRIRSPREPGRAEPRTDGPGGGAPARPDSHHEVF